MIRFTIRRCMHDRKMPSITQTHIFPVISSSYESPRKYDYHKPIKQETSCWKKLWPKYRIHSQQYREYKATRGDGSIIDVWDRPPQKYDIENELWTKAKPYEHAEAEEKEAIWGEINHDYTNMEGEESNEKKDVKNSKKN